MSPAVAYIETNHDISNSLLVISSGRSGSTWLGELLSQGADCRLIFESLHKSTSREFHRFAENVFLEEGASELSIDLLLQRVLSGRVRSRWCDAYNHSRRPTHRVLKEVMAGNLLPRIVKRYPELPVIYLIRNPLACAWSWTRLNVGDLGDFTAQRLLMTRYFDRQRATIVRQAFLSNVHRWCLENTVPLAAAGGPSVLVLFYEDLVERPELELRRVESFLRREGRGKWRTWAAADVSTVDRPSVMALPGRGRTWRSPRGRVQSSLNELPAEWVGAAWEIVREFGLDWLYDDRGTPKLAADEVEVRMH